MAAMVDLLLLCGHCDSYCLLNITEKRRILCKDLCVNHNHNHNHIYMAPLRGGVRGANPVAEEFSTIL